MIKLQLTLDRIDYDKLIDLLMPTVMEKLAESDDPKLRMASMLPPKMAKAALGSLSDDKKEEITALLLERYKENLVSMLCGMAQQKGLSFEIRDVKVDRI